MILKSVRPELRFSADMEVSWCSSLSGLPTKQMNLTGSAGFVNYQYKDRSPNRCSVQEDVSPVSKRDGAEARVRCRQHVVGARTIPGPECSPLDGAPLLARGLGSDWQSGAHRNAAGHKSIAHVKGSFAYRRATLAVRNEKYGNIKLLAERRHKRAR